MRTCIRPQAPTHRQRTMAPRATRGTALCRRPSRTRNMSFEPAETVFTRPTAHRICSPAGALTAACLWGPEAARRALCPAPARSTSSSGRSARRVAGLPRRRRDERGPHPGGDDDNRHPARTPCRRRGDPARGWPRPRCRARGWLDALSHPPSRPNRTARQRRHQLARRSGGHVDRRRFCRHPGTDRLYLSLACGARRRPGPALIGTG